MAGGEAAYDAVSSYTSTAAGLTITVWGEPKRVYRRIERRAAGAPREQVIEIGVDVEDRVSMVLEVGRSADTDSLADLVRRRTSVTGREVDLADASVPL